MKWKFDYFEEEGFVRITEEDLFTPEGCGKMLKELMLQDFWKPGLNILFDMTNLDLSRTKYEEIRSAAQNLNSHESQLGGSKIALYMKSLTDFGKGRQFGMLVDKQLSTNIIVFLDEDQALGWLNAKISGAGAT